MREIAYKIATLWLMAALAAGPLLRRKLLRPLSRSSSNKPAARLRLWWCRPRLLVRPRGNLQHSRPLRTSRPRCCGVRRI